MQYYPSGVHHWVRPGRDLTGWPGLFKLGPHERDALGHARMRDLHALRHWRALQARGRRADSLEELRRGCRFPEDRAGERERLAPAGRRAGGRDGDLRRARQSPRPALRPAAGSVVVLRQRSAFHHDERRIRLPSGIVSSRCHGPGIAARRRSLHDDADVHRQRLVGHDRGQGRGGATGERSGHDHDRPLLERHARLSIGVGRGRYVRAARADGRSGRRRSVLHGHRRAVQDRQSIRDGRPGIRCPDAIDRGTDPARAAASGHRGDRAPRRARPRSRSKPPRMKTQASIPMSSFLEARDFLLAKREDYAGAYAGFQWPKLDTFNWALDFFDAQAQGNARPALWIVNENGAEEKRSFDEMRRRSNRVANFLRAQGVKRGDRIVLMLSNVVPLWEITLAVLKLGAVASPATLLLTRADLADRVERGEI